MGKKITGYKVDPKTGGVRTTDETLSRGAAKSAGGRHGDFQKDGLGGRVVDALLSKLKK